MLPRGDSNVDHGFPGGTAELHEGRAPLSSCLGQAGSSLSPPPSLSSSPVPKAAGAQTRRGPVAPEGHGQQP